MNSWQFAGFGIGQYHSTKEWSQKLPTLEVREQFVSSTSFQQTKSKNEKIVRNVNAENLDENGENVPEDLEEEFFWMSLLWKTVSKVRNIFEAFR